MESIIIVVHILLALAIVGLIMLQQGKGAEMGASFGSGGSQTVFGSTGGGTFLSRMTAVLVTLFFITSFGLTIMAKKMSGADSEEGIPSAAVIETINQPPVDNSGGAASGAAAPASDIPVVEQPSAASDVPAISAEQPVAPPAQ